MRREASNTADTAIACPFSIVVDTREQAPYTFDSIYSNAAQQRRRIVVPTVRHALPVGDYSLFGLPSITIERKSKADLYASVTHRANFIGRLERMGNPTIYTYAAVIVEAEYIDLLASPPPFSRLRPRSLSRTLIAWSIRYPVRWWFVRDRAAAEILTFRLLDRFWHDHARPQTTTTQKS